MCVGGRGHLSTANANLEFCFVFFFFASVSSCKICVEKVQETVEKEGEEEEKWLSRDMRRERGDVKANRTSWKVLLARLPCLPHCGFLHVCVCATEGERERVGEREVPHQGNELKVINREEKRNSAKMGGNKSPLIESSF